MIKLSDYQTQDSLPAGMQTAEWIALSYAFDSQKKKYMDRIKRAYIWADLESVEDGKLDFLAVESRVLFYNADLAPDIKRELIRNSIYWYMKLGTRQAMEEMIHIVFGEGEVKEWFEYGDEPFYFKVNTSAILSQEMNDFFSTMIQRVKNARSHLRVVEINRETSQGTFAGSASHAWEKPAAIMDGHIFTRKTIQGTCAGVGMAQIQKNIVVLGQVNSRKDEEGKNATAI